MSDSDSASDSRSPHPSGMSGEGKKPFAGLVTKSKRKESGHTHLYEKIPAKKAPARKPVCYLAADAAVLSDRDVLKEMEQENVVISPFVPSQLNSCSYDVTLGPYYFRSRPRALAVFNPFCAEHARAYWGGEAKEAEKAGAEEAELYGLAPGASYIRLEPGETILAHTAEFIGGRKYITTMLRARSTMGRSNVTVCRDAGWGDIGYVNRWALQVSNQSGVPVVLPVGARLAQIVFLYSSEPRESYSGSYQDKKAGAEEKEKDKESVAQKIEAMAKKWRPEDLLPKVRK